MIRRHIGSSLVGRAGPVGLGPSLRAAAATLAALWVGGELRNCVSAVGNLGGPALQLLRRAAPLRFKLSIARRGGKLGAVMELRDDKGALLKQDHDIHVEHDCKLLWTGSATRSAAGSTVWLIAWPSRLGPRQRGSLLTARKSRS